MCGDKGVIVEMWPLAADKKGIWLPSGRDALRSGRVPQDHRVHDDAVDLLSASWLVEPTILHSPSWRDIADPEDPYGPNVVLTYFAVLDNEGKDVVEIWPEAMPVDVEQLIELVGNPPTHDAAEAPDVRWLDVLLHSLRHLRLLMGGDVTVLGMDGEVAAKLTDDWKRHLQDLTPALAGLFASKHEGWV